MKRVFACIGFSFAVTLLVVNIVPVGTVRWIMIWLAALLAASLVIAGRKQAVICISLISAVFACAVFLCTYYGNAAPQLELGGKSAQCTYYFTDDGEISGDKYTYIIRTQSVGLSDAPQNIKLKLNSDEKLDIEPYTLVTSNLDFYAPYENAPSSYGRWGENIFLTVRSDAIKSTGKNVASPWKYSLKIRKFVNNVLNASVKNDEGALGAAFLTGNKSNLSAKVRSYFTFGGASHLMAVSGLHLTVIAAILSFVFKKLRLNSKLSALLLVLTVIFYIGVAGFSKSIVRSAIMVCIMLFGRIVGKRSDTLNSLGVAVFVICLNPFAVYDLSALLSVLAVLSLSTLCPLLNSHYKAFMIKHFKMYSVAGNAVLKIVNGIVSSVITAAGVTLFTLPVMYAFFGYCTLSGVISNIILVPLGSLSMILSLAVCFLFKIPFIGTAAAYLCRILNSFIIYLVEVFSSGTLSVVKFNEYSGIIIAAALVVFSVPFLSGRIKLLRASAFVCAVMFVVFCIFDGVYFEKLPECYILNTAAVATYKGKTVVLGVDSYSSYYSVSNYVLSNTGRIDLLLVTGETDEYSLRLAEDIPCETYISSRFSSEITQNDNILNAVTSNNYSNTLAEDFALMYNFTDVECSVLLTLGGLNFSFGDMFKGDVSVDGGVVSDSKGKIDAEFSPVIYTVYESSTFSARRISVWQK